MLLSPIGYRQQIVLPSGGGEELGPFPELAGVYARWDFSDLSSLFQDTGETTPVASHNDPIGRAKDFVSSAHANQTTSGKRPLLKLNQLNGRAMAFFDGTDDLLMAQYASTHSPPFAYAAVVRLVAGGHAISGRDNTSGTNTSSAMGINGTGNFTMFNGSTMTTGTHDPNEYYILSYRFHGSAGAGYLRVNGVLQTQGSTGGRTLRQIGFGANARDALYSQCYIGDVVFFNGDVAPETENWTVLESYLSEKWGIPLE